MNFCAFHDTTVLIAINHVVTGTAPPLAAKILMTGSLGGAIVIE